MAMRPRRVIEAPNPKPRSQVARVYESFYPMTEWRLEDDYDTLLVYLPGFQKEYIRVTTEDVNIVRVRGERWIAENKWSRFQEDFRVPENCEMRGIRAKFDGGILTITMPKKIITVPVARKPEEPPLRRIKQEEMLVQKPKEVSKERATTSSNAALESQKKPEKPQKPLKDSTSTLPPRAQPMPTKQEPLKTRPQDKEADEEVKTYGSVSSSVPKKDKHDGVGKTDLEDGKAKQALLEEEKKMGLESKKQVMNGRKGLNEDRKTMVNMGVGLLVLVALGVHVSYTIGLIGKGK